MLFLLRFMKLSPNSTLVAEPDALIMILPFKTTATALLFLTTQIGFAQPIFQHPVPADVSLTFDEPWEGSTSNYVTVFQDGPLYRMYYRGSEWDRESVTCYAESTDGIHWKKPNLGLF